VNKQITTCKIDVKAYNGVSNYSFQGYPKEVSLFSGTVDWKPYYFDGSASDKALSGRLRSHLAGYRMEGSLFWERQTNASNFVDILNKSTVGVEKNFWTGQIDDSYTTKSNIVIPSGPAENDALNGMRMEIPTVGNYTITDYYASNTTAILNTAISLTGTELFNVVATANMEPTVIFYPDASATTNEAIIFNDSAFSVQIESTVTSQPTRIDFSGRDFSNTIPSAYQV